MYTEIDPILGQVFENAIRKSKLFQTHCKVQCEFLDAMELEIQASEDQENNEEDLLKSFEELTTITRELRALLVCFPDINKGRICPQQ